MSVFPIRAFFFATLVAGFSAPAKADPIADILGSIFGQQASLHPSEAGWRRTHTRRAGAPAGAVDRGALLASYYGGGERLNRHTASGALFHASGLTAAHRSLPFGTQLLVSRSGRTVVVTVNDRGPARWTGRSLDLSRGAAARLAMLGDGVARVNVQVLR